MSARFDHISPERLPVEWTKTLGLKPGQQVSVTIEPEKPENRFNRRAIQQILADVDKLPVLDDSAEDDIIKYDENGLPA